MRNRDSGVTLIEMLVVLALIGVGAGIATYALPSGPAARTVAQEATLLSTRLNLAAERSLIGGRSVRLDWDAKSYGFDEWTGDGWGVTPVAALSARHVLEGVTQLFSDTSALSGEMTITPDLLPSAGRLRLFRLGSGAVARTVVFDGASASLRESTE